MMKKNILLFVSLYSGYAFAQIPLFTIVPQGSLPTTVDPFGTTTAQYTVTNNAPYTLEDLGLFYQPVGQTPFGVLQTTTSTNTPPTCANPFNLGPLSSCTLDLIIVGEDLIDGVAIGGPEVCFKIDSPSRCSVPAPGSQLNISRNPIVQLGLAVGTDNLAALGFFVQSTDLGLNWSLGNFPVDSPAVQLNVSACGVGNFCVIGGNDVNNTFTLIQTTDMGNDWTVPNLPAFKSFSTNHNSIFNTSVKPPAATVACLNSQCIAGGFDVNGAGSLYQTLNQGSSWSLINIPQISPPPSGITTSFNPQWFGSACDASLCLMVGADVNNLNEPILAQASPGSTSWSYVDLSGFTDIWMHGTLTSAACSGEICSAVGLNLNNPELIILVTTDGGASWSEGVIESSPPNPLANSYLNSTSCGNFSGTVNCFAAGGISSAFEPPLLMSSTPAGVDPTWYEVTITSSATGGALNSVSCSNDICVAVGQDGTSTLLLYQFTIAGGWTQVDLSSITTSTGALLSASCQGLICTAAGQTGTRRSVTPFLIQTLDGGVSWQQVTVSGTTTNGKYNGTTAP